MSDRAPLACPACCATMDAPRLRRCRVAGSRFGREVRFNECKKCGMVFAPENVHHYPSAAAFGTSSRPRAENLRVGNEQRPGREFHMGSMAVDILRAAGLPARDAVVYGPGLSLDHEWLARTYPELQVATSDLQNFQNHANFVALDSARRFDVVIACEVAEHFTDPAADLGALLGKLSGSGIAVLSTNICDGSDIELQEYPFIAGHTSYYSGRALAELVRRIDPDLRVDFRLPLAATSQLGPRKRYVLIGNREVSRGIADYFASHALAPSEPAYLKLGLVRRWQRFKRWATR